MSDVVELESDKIGTIIFRLLENKDAKELGAFFDGLSDTTRSYYGPHPLNSIEAKTICNSLPEKAKKRFVAILDNMIVGYFLIDFHPFPHERNRFLNHGIELDSLIDPVFAPCISDRYQGKGLASLVMPIIIEWAKNHNLRSIVLMGGTQEPNKRARAFYHKFGFKEYSWFYTENNGVNNVDMRLVL